MLSQVRGIHTGKSIAVLGSGPSVRLFKRREEVVIGVNGAGQLLKKGDYFLSGDERAHTRSWFLELPDDITCVLKPQSAMYSTKFYPDANTRQKLIGFYESYMDANPDKVHVSDDGFRSVRPGNEVIDAFLAGFPAPEKPHIIIRKFALDHTISRDMDTLITGATSSCVAMLLAFVMGADSIHLYGVQFNNEAKGKPTSFTGGNYFYVPKHGEKGRTTEIQLSAMDSIIAKVRELGTAVYSYGFTRLKNTIKAAKRIEVLQEV